MVVVLKVVSVLIVHKSPSFEIVAIGVAAAAKFLVKNPTPGA